MIDDILLEAEEKMEKAIEFSREEFTAIRTGRANAAMFNPITVEYYGAPTPLQQLATISIPEPRTVLISPYDKSSTNDVIKAVRDSDLGVNPTDEGNHIRVTLPELTEERRRNYVKLAGQKAEEGRVSIRGIRRKAMDQLEKLKKDGEAGEDEVTRAEKEIESLTKKQVETMDKLLAAKEKELMEI